MEREIRLTFIVEKDGSLSNIKISKDLEHDTGKEGIKAIKRSKKCSPGIRRLSPTNNLLSIKP